MHLSLQHCFNQVPGNINVQVLVILLRPISWISKNHQPFPIHPIFQCSDVPTLCSVHAHCACGDDITLHPLDWVQHNNFVCFCLCLLILALSALQLCGNLLEFVVMLGCEWKHTKFFQRALWPAFVEFWVPEWLNFVPSLYGKWPNSLEELSLVKHVTIRCTHFLFVTGQFPIAFGISMQWDIPCTWSHVHWHEWAVSCSEVLWDPSFHRNLCPHEPPTVSFFVGFHCEPLSMGSQQAFAQAFNCSGLFNLGALGQLVNPVHWCVMWEMSLCVPFPDDWSFWSCLTADAFIVVHQVSMSLKCFSGFGWHALVFVCSLNGKSWHLVNQVWLGHVCSAIFVLAVLVQCLQTFVFASIVEPEVFGSWTDGTAVCHWMQLQCNSQFLHSLAS